MSGGSGARIQMMKQQADSVTTVATPVSGTKYEWLSGESGAGAALGTQKNCRILGASISVTWAVTQPTPIEIHFTVDDEPITFSKADPTTATAYIARELSLTQPALTQVFTLSIGTVQAFLLEGRSVKVECEITWATTQPTNLKMRVKWAKIP